MFEKVRANFYFRITAQYGADWVIYNLIILFYAFIFRYMQISVV